MAVNKTDFMGYLNDTTDDTAKPLALHKSNLYWKLVVSMWGVFQLPVALSNWYANE